jgi:glycosyltransferase involved in cell wall biosynthesis
MYKISVVVPTYKRPLLLADCIECLALQDFAKENFEVIVVSDGPDPDTAVAITQWRSSYNLSIRYEPLPEKKGPAAARNFGWQSSQATLVAFTDDDCRPSPEWLSSIWSKYHNESLIAFTGKTIVPRPHRPTDYELNTAGLETAEFITANCALSRAALIYTGGFDETFTMAWREDSDLHFKLITRNIPIKKVERAI